MKSTNNVKKFIDVIKLRHSDYTLTNGTVIPDTKLVKFIKECIYYHPSAFNVQSTRIVLLFDGSCYKLWDHVLNSIPQNFPELLVNELKCCRSGHATLLFFDDEEVTENASKQYHMNLDDFKSWALQSMAMLQNVLWNGITYLGYGVNIQHFNRELEEYVRSKFNVPKQWKLLSQLNLGLISGKTPNRKRIPVKNILFVER
jgi:predicted oxidoreductase (fatty acid repression mutant protein)